MTPSEKQAFDAMREALEKHGSAPLDWACVKCRPESHCLKKDFLCRYHAALAAADAVAEQGQPKPPISREHWLAIREGHFNAAAEQYFNARPQLDTAAQRRVFYAGHCAGYGESPTETPAERMAGARAKWDDTYPGDLLARIKD